MDLKVRNSKSQKDWKTDNSKIKFNHIRRSTRLYPTPLRLEHVCVARQRISRFSTSVICFSKARLASWMLANISSFLSSSLSLPDSSWINKFHSCWSVRSSKKLLQTQKLLPTVQLPFWQFRHVGCVTLAKDELCDLNQGVGSQLNAMFKTWDETWTFILNKNLNDEDKGDSNNYYNLQLL